MGGVDCAIVLATAPGAGTVVAGLPLAVRAVLAAREARFDEVGLVVPDQPRWAAEPLARRGVSVRWIEAPLRKPPQMPDLRGGLTLLLAGDVLVDADAVGSLRDAPPGPVVTSDGRLVGLVCAAAEAVAWLGCPDQWMRSSASRTRLAAGLAVPLETAGSPTWLERALLDHLVGQATSDSYLAALIDRPLSRPLTRLLLRTPVGPSHVTLLGVATGLLGAAGLATVSYWGRLGGVLLLVASLVLDCVDGDLARARLAQNPVGARLDVVGDYLVNLAVFAGLAVGLLREGLTTEAAGAALGLMTGVGAAMAAVHVLFIRPALQRGGDLHWAGDSRSLRGRPGATVLEKVASRDYTYLLLTLATVGHLDWFLYAAAVGAWLFTAALFGYRWLTPGGGRRAGRSRR
jgi:phosphatidylglycerophosphate synthase